MHPLVMCRRCGCVVSVSLAAHRSFHRRGRRRGSCRPWSRAERLGVRSLPTCLSLNVMSSCRHDLWPASSSRYCVTTVEAGKLRLPDTSWEPTGSHYWPASGYIGQAEAFDFRGSTGIEPQPAMPGDAGISFASRGQESESFSSTEFLQVKAPVRGSPALGMGGRLWIRSMAEATSVCRFWQLAVPSGCSSCGRRLG